MASFISFLQWNSLISIKYPAQGFEFTTSHLKVSSQNYLTMAPRPDKKSLVARGNIKRQTLLFSEFCFWKKGENLKKKNFKFWYFWEKVVLTYGIVTILRDFDIVLTPPELKMFPFTINRLQPGPTPTKIFVCFLPCFSCKQIITIAIRKDKSKL